MKPPKPSVSIDYIISVFFCIMNLTYTTIKRTNLSFPLSIRLFRRELRFPRIKIVSPRASQVHGPKRHGARTHDGLQEPKNLKIRCFFSSFRRLGIQILCFTNCKIFSGIIKFLTAIVDYNCCGFVLQLPEDIW